MERLPDRENEQTLIRRILKGDKDSFSIIIENHKRLVMHIVYKMIRGNTEREDISQEIFIKVYQNLRGFRGESKLSTWIARIAYHHCINYIEKKENIYPNITLQEPQHNRNLWQKVESADQTMTSKDISDRLQREIEKIPPRYRTILTLYHMDGFSYSEIAEITGLPEGTVKNYLFRARKKLKQLLLNQYEPEELQ